MGEDHGHLVIFHGNLRLRIPLSIFKGRTQVVDPEEWERFSSLLTSRYPWLSPNALEVILENAKEERSKGLEEGKPASRRARELMDRGRLTRALALLNEHLGEDPDDGEAWMLRGELLCRMGRREEGYRSFAEGRSR
ncbi:MAG: tetratricopeptide repeat protein [Methanomassiliicoccales archaeon]